MSLLKKLAGDTAIYGLSTIIGRVLNFLLVPLYTRILLDSEYGVVAEFYAYVGFLNVIFIYRMETAFFRFGNEAKQRQPVFNTAAFSIFCSSLFFVGLLILFSQPIANFLEYPDKRIFVIWFAFIIGFDALSAIPFARLRLEGKAIQFATIKFINIGLNIGFNLFFLLLCPYLINQGFTAFEHIYNPDFQIGYIFISNLIASAATLLLLVPTYFFKTKHPQTIDLPSSKKAPWFDKALWKKMFRYAGPLVIVGFAGIINETLDRVLLKNCLEGDLDYRTAQIGIYNANYKIAMLITLFTTAFTYAAEPFFFSNANREDAKDIYAIVGQVFAMVGCIGFLGIMLYIDIFKYFVGADFRDGLNVVPIILIANIFLGLYYNIGIWYKLTDKTIYGAFISIGGASITIILNLILIPKIGYLGSAWATLVCYVIMVFCSYFIGKKHYPVPYKAGRILTYIISAITIYLISLPLREYLGVGSILLFAMNTILFLSYLGTLLFVERAFFKEILAKKV